MKIKRIISLLLIVCLTLGLTLTACGNPEENENQEETIDKVKITYSLWGKPERVEYTRESIEIFEELYPNIDVQLVSKNWLDYQDDFYRKMKTGLESDVMQINYNWIDTFSDNGKGFYDLYELSDYIDLTNFSNEVLSLGTVNKNLNAIPIALTSSVSMYSEAMLKKYVLDIPNNWNELIYMGQILKRDKNYLYVLEPIHIESMLFTYYSQVKGKSIFYRNGKHSLKTKDFEKLLDYYKRLKDNNVIYVAKDEQEVISVLKERKAVGLVGWNSKITDYSNTMKENGDNLVIGDFLNAYNSRSGGYFIKPASMLAISKHTKHPKEAALLMNYLLNSKENILIQKDEKGIPASREAELALMEAGLLNTMEYRTKLVIDYNINIFENKPPCLEDSKITSKFIEHAEDYVKGDLTREKAALLLWTLFSDYYIEDDIDDSIRALP